MMALRSAVVSKMPMVIILGATGTGKTKLGVELAQKYNTEVISADSMQIYKGLDVVTAKATPQERGAVKHHLLDILEPTQMFTVVDFRNRALKLIDELSQERKIPLIVGGTVYYVESIIYHILVDDMDDENALLWDVSRRKRDYDDGFPAEHSKMPKLDTTSNVTKDDDEMLDKRNLTVNNEEQAKDELKDDKPPEAEESRTVSEKILTKDELTEIVNNESSYTNEQLHDKLRNIDPGMANRLHPNNRRKVLRSMEVWLKSGRRHSDILAEQQQTEGKLRMPDATIIFWLKCDQTVHDERLNSRVDSMLRDGLIEELLDFHDRHNKRRMMDGQPPDYTKGIFQTLGFKEFHEYLMLPEDERNSKSGQELLQTSIENMKMATRRYARRQNKMIRGRFLEHPNREVPPIYELDTTDVSKWDENVRNKAIEIIESYLNKTLTNYEPIKSVIEEDKRNIDGNSSNYCKVCNRLIIGDRTYQIHLKSNKHMKVLKMKRKLEEKTQKNDD